MAIKQISVFLENKPGALQDMCRVLADHKIDMRALSLVETKDFGIARIIVDNVLDTTTVLRDASFVNRLTPVIAVCIPDEPGGLNRVLEIFTKNNTNLEYMYAFLGSQKKHAYMIFRVGENEKAAEAALTAAGIKIVTQEEISEI
ncbi:MAG: acetolactate synthase [Eubacterium sp.]|nr:acetolactate synthase [Eubacterium sp.]MCR4752584.1 acetolactate synthase [Eubacterium sp.]